MARSTYHDQFHKLVDKGYLVAATGNTFDFYEVPQTATQVTNLSSAGIHESTGGDNLGSPDGHTVLSEDIEINNIPNKTNGINNSDPVSEEMSIRVPEVKEIVIPRPKAEGRERPKPIRQVKEQEFVF